MRFKLFENQKLRSVVFTLIAVFSFNLMGAQTKKVTGKVTDDKGVSLIGVSISVKSTGKLTITDFDGNFEIALKKGDVLLADYMGYANKTLAYKGQSNLVFVLEESAESLDEVIVVGYGEQKKKEVTGAVVKVKSEVLEQTTTSDIGAALQGQISGVSVTASSGEPGAEANILIRGFSSIMEGQNKPLYVVDGIPYDNDPGLSVSEIESIDVLKDAASASIYGTRGAGGVILITTKQGKVGSMKVSVRGEYGVQNITSNTPLLNTNQKMYVDLLQVFLRPSNNVSIDQIWSRTGNDEAGFVRNTNLEETILNDLAPIQNYSINISGGKKDLVYSFNGNYFNQEGVIVNSDFKRFNVRSNARYTSGKFKMISGLTFRRDERVRPDGNIFLQIFRYAPNKPAVDLDADRVEDGGDDDVEIRQLAGILRNITRVENETRNFNAGNLQLEYDVTKEFKLTARGGANFTDTKRVERRKEFSVVNNQGQVIQPIDPNQRSSVRNTHIESSKFTFEAMMNYRKEIGRHKFNLLFVNSMEKSERNTFYAQRALNAFGDRVVGLNSYLDYDLSDTPANDFSRTLIGYLGRLQYNFDEKYLLSASVRRDGSSMFSRENRWGWFPSVSVGWNVSDEAFWSPLKSVVKNFKLRASYGTTGNDRFTPYQFEPYIDSGFNYATGGSEEVLRYGKARTRQYNPDIKWETSIERNFGADFGFFKNQLTFTANKNEVTKTAENNPFINLNNGHVGNSNQDFITVITKGYEAGAFFMFKQDGVIQTQEELDAYTSDVVDGEGNVLKKGVTFIGGTVPQLGDSKIRDINGDGLIDDNDRTYVGSGTPDFEMGFNFNASYKNFDLAMQWFGSYGGEIVNGSKTFAYHSGLHRDLFYAWSPFNTDTNIPANRGGNSNSQTNTFSYRGNSDYFLEDGSFLRLRNIALGYTIPKKISKKMGVNKLRFYIQAQNALTFTKYTGFDPEVGNNGLSTRGLDKGTFPMTAQYKGGIQLQF
ncbi:SusC/RagA family TonB-linked outer membrane protein [Wenyingzhuangia sp. IMCC45574]